MRNQNLLDVYLNIAYPHKKLANEYFCEWTKVSLRRV